MRNVLYLNAFDKQKLGRVRKMRNFISVNSLHSTIFSSQKNSNSKISSQKVVDIYKTVNKKPYAN